MRKMGEGIETLLRGWVESNPERELTYDEAQRMFGCSRRDLTQAVYILRASGYVETPHVIRANRGDE